MRFPQRCGQFKLEFAEVSGESNWFHPRWSRHRNVRHHDLLLTHDGVRWHLCPSTGGMSRANNAHLIISRMH
jgi:hypothetical protein